MGICSNCQSDADVFDVIGGEEIVKMCYLCIIREDVPMIKKPTAEQWLEAQRVRNVHERLVSMATNRDKTAKQQPITVTKIESTLVENFHWLIQKARKAKGMTQKQLALALAEKEDIIKEIESGKIPLDSEKAISKIEQLFQIKLKKYSVQHEKNKFNDAERMKISELREFYKKSAQNEVFAS